jgi:EmrB/QacA subfamily drug resistance transporter
MSDTQRATQWTALTVAGVSSFLTPFMGSAVNIAVPAIGDEFGMSAVALSWVATAYLLASAAFLLPTGRLADLYGRKRVLRTGLAINMAASLLLVFVSSGPALLALRGLQGLGGQMIFCTNMAILISVFPPAQRGRALGINVAAVYLGLSLGPPLGGVLTEYLGWRSIFVFTFLLSALALALVLWKLKGEWAEAQGERFDVPGAVLYVLAVVALVCGANFPRHPAGMALLAGGAASAAGFLVWELKTPQPLVDLGLFRRNPVFAFSNLAALIHYAAIFALTFLLSLYLQKVRGLTALTAGLVLVAQPVIMAAFSPFAGWLSDRVEPRIVASSGMAVTTLGLGLLAFLTETTPLGWLVADLLLLGLGFAFFSSPNTNAVMSSVARPVYGVASAILSTMRQLGMVVSMALVALCLTVYVGRAELTPETYPAFMQCLKVAFLIFAGLCSLGLFASLARGNVRPERSDREPSVAP